MKATVFGVATQINGSAAEYSPTGRFTGAHSYRDLTTDLPEGGALVDLDHDGTQIGELIYAEIAPDQRVHTVAVVEGLDLEQIDQDVYFSPQLLMVGDGINERSTYIAREASLLGLALTLAPCTVAAQPLRWREGDLRSSLDRGKWSWRWQLDDPLLVRALGHLGTGFGVERRAATRIVDQRRRLPPLEPSPRRTATIEYRSAELADVSASHRSLDVIVMPYETPTVVEHHGRRVHEICSRGAFDTIDRDGGRVRVNRDHNFTRPIGRATAFDPAHAQGLWARLKISRTRDGDEALELAREQILDVSAGFAVDTNGETWPSANVRRLTRASLHHIALVSNAAYPDARVLAVRGLAGAHR